MKMAPVGLLRCTLRLIVCLLLFVPIFERAQAHPPARAAVQTARNGRPELVLQTGHTKAVNSVAFSPKGHWLVSAAQDNTIRIWDTETGHELRAISGGDPVLSADGKLLSASSEDKSIRIWDVETGLEATRLEVKNVEGPETPIAFVPDSRRLVSCGAETVRIWDLPSKRVVQSFSARNLGQCALSPDGRWLAAGTTDKDKKVLIWDLTRAGDPRALPLKPEWQIRVLAFSPDGRFLASTGQDRTISLWEVGSWNLAREIAGNAAFKVGSSFGIALAPSMVPFNLAFSPDAHFLASAQVGRSPKVWEVATGSEKVALDPCDVQPGAVSFSLDGRRLAAACGPNVLIYDLRTGHRVRTLTSGTGRIQTMMFSSDGRWLASANVWGVSSSLAMGISLGVGLGSVSLWEAPTGRALHKLALGNWTEALTFSIDGHLMASGGQDGSIRLWEPWTGRAAGAQPVADRDHVLAVALSLDQRWLASASLNGLKLWRLTRSQLTPVPLPDSNVSDRSLGPPPFDKAVEAVAFVPDGRRLVAGYYNGRIEVWEHGSRDSWARSQTWSAHDGDLRCLAVSPDRGLLASSGGSVLLTSAGTFEDHRAVKIWNLETKQLLQELPSAVESLAFSPDSHSLLAGGKDGTFQLWEAATRRFLRPWKGHSGAVRAVGFTTNGRIAVTGSEDGTIRLWDAHSGDLLITLVSFRDPADDSAALQHAVFAESVRQVDSRSMVPPGRVDWLVLTPDGLFDGSPPAWQKILWRFGNNTFDVAPPEIFFREFYRPGLLAEVLNGGRPRAPKDIAKLDRRQPYIKFALGNQPSPAGAMASRTTNVRIEVTEVPPDKDHPERGSGVRDVRLFRNGSLVKIWRGDLKLDAHGRAKLETEVPIVAGENRFTAYAFNNDNIKSSDATLELRGSKSRERGRAYVVAVGVKTYANPDFNLTVTDKDAKQFAAEFQHQQEALGQLYAASPAPLVNENATKKNILDAVRDIGKKIEPEDILVLYLSGHGMFQKDPDWTRNEDHFYFVPYDVGYMGKQAAMTEDDEKILLAHSISDRDLNEVLEGVDARRIILIVDACHSGGVLGAAELSAPMSAEQRAQLAAQLSFGGPINARGLAQLAYDKGMYVLTAAQSKQAALEFNEGGLSYLTYVLVQEGMRTSKADTSPRDGIVTLEEWLDYATVRVPEMQSQKMVSEHALGKNISVVPGQKSLSPERRDVQRPRVFTPREPPLKPIVIARTPRSP